MCSIWGYNSKFKWSPIFCCKPIEREDEKHQVTWHVKLLLIATCTQHSTTVVVLVKRVERQLSGWVHSTNRMSECRACSDFSDAFFGDAIIMNCMLTSVWLEQTAHNNNSYFHLKKTFLPLRRERTSWSWWTQAECSKLLLAKCIRRLGANQQA